VPIKAFGCLPFSSCPVAQPPHLSFSHLPFPALRGWLQGPGLLQALCEKVVVPNIRLRASDLEVFEDNPIEFIRR